MSTLRDAMSHAALGWVKPELDETLRQVRNEVEYYAEDPSDAGRMRFCAGYLHQVQGTLRMVELYARRWWPKNWSSWPTPSAPARCPTVTKPAPP